MSQHEDERDGLFDEVKHPKRRAWLRAYALTGNKTRAAEAAGVFRTAIYSQPWLDDAHFQASLVWAEKVAADGLEDEARRRATEGLKSYKFTKDGTPIYHPVMCHCDHERHFHKRREKVDDLEPCQVEGCLCDNFAGIPYFEHAYSDNLLMFLSKGLMPEKYKDRMELKGSLASLDVTKLPHHLLARIAAGEHPLQVLAEAATEGLDRTKEVPAKLIAPPAPDEGEG